MRGINNIGAKACDAGIRGATGMLCGAEIGCGTGMLLEQVHCMEVQALNFTPVAIHSWVFMPFFQISLNRVPGKNCNHVFWVVSEFVGIRTNAVDTLPAKIKPT